MIKKRLFDALTNINLFLIEEAADFREKNEFRLEKRILDYADPLLLFPELEETHGAIVRDYFEEQQVYSGVSPEENRQLLQKLQETAAYLQQELKKLRWQQLGRGFLLVLGSIGAIVAGVGTGLSFEALEYLATVFWGLVMSIPAFLTALLWFQPVIAATKEQIHLLQMESQDLEEQVDAQMAPLIARFRDTDGLRLVEEAVPDISFEGAYSVEQEAFLGQYGFCHDSTNQERSVTDTLSGTFRGNPFVYLHEIVHTMGWETYSGSRTIHWTESYQDDDGNWQNRETTQTLSRSITRPKPFYSTPVSLIYGCQTAQDLHFSRGGQHVERKTDRALARYLRTTAAELQRMQRQAVKRGETFQVMHNDRFEVLFLATNRDDEVAYRTMFSPQAQEKLSKLLLDGKIGYGDDFTFEKCGGYNRIQSEHSQPWPQGIRVKDYASRDFEKMQNKFCALNQRFFKALFFDLAPFMSIPSYMDAPVPERPAPSGESNFTPCVHEAVVRSMDVRLLAHEKSCTEVILKTAFQEKDGLCDVVQVTALSYQTTEETDHEFMMGEDGAEHDVPVDWINYIPLEQTSRVRIGRRETLAAELQKEVNCSGHYDIVGIVIPEPNE